MSSPLEKSKDMQNRYALYGEDPWGNRERQLYQKIFKKATELTYSYLSNINDITLYDIGCGGGNIIDVWKENLPKGKNLRISGCDISEDAIKFLKQRYPEGKFDLIDLETYVSHVNDSNYEMDYFTYHILNSNIVSIVDVMYYFGEKRDYKDTLDEIWKSIKPGTLVIVADNLVRSFRRDYLTKKKDCELLESFTDYNSSVCEEVSDSGKHWHRYLKIRIMRKL